MKKVIIKTALAVAAVALLAASCSKQEFREEQSVLNNRQIEIRSYNVGGGSQYRTKAAIAGTKMPVDRDIMISAYYNSPASGQEGSLGVTFNGTPSGNYFSDVPFSYNSENDTWTSAYGPVFWPMKGTLDFLAYSSEDARLNAEWNVDNCASEVVLDNFSENLSFSDDLLYGSANAQSYSSAGVPMEFNHLKSLIVFTAKSSNADAITITKIVINGLEQIDNAKTQLTITNNGAEPAAAVWNKAYKAPADVVVPGIDGISYNVPTKAMNVTKKATYLGIGGQGIMIPEQEMKSFTVYFEQKGAGDNVIKESFTYDCQIGEAEDSEWQMGKRYIYELNFKVNEIEVAASVVPWDDDLNGSVDFKDAKFEEYCLEHFDTDGDGELSYKEASAVTEIDIDSNGITELNLEPFTNLSTLRCYLRYDSRDTDASGVWHHFDSEGNEIFGLKYLDVTHNPKLYILQCNDNQLASLDLTQNTELMGVNCDSNYLTDIDFSKNSKMVIISCDENQITGLDLSKNIELQILGCRYNKLEEINLTKNYKLQEFNCDGNKLSSLDLEKNIKLEKLTCSQNNITGELDLSKNTQLENIYCSDNSISVLDLSNNKALYHLSCSNNNLETIDVSNNLSLDEFFCDPMESLKTIYIAKGQTITYYGYPSGVDVIEK